MHNYVTSGLVRVGQVCNINTYPGSRLHNDGPEYTVVLHKCLMNQHIFELVCSNSLNVMYDFGMLPIISEQQQQC